VTFFTFLNSHKTKITGFLLVIAGALQANTTVLQAVMTPAQFAWFTVIVGCIVAGLGFINGNKPQP
jgi:hypothetical protein